MGIPATLSTVPAQTPYIQYVATSGQTVYPYPFEITQDSDLTIVYNGVTLGTDSGYTVSGVGNSTGGDATFTSGATADDIVTLYRDIPIERLTQFGQNSGFSSTAFNAEFNNVYLLLQQLQQNIGQCLQIPNTNNPTPTVSLTPAAYANKYLSFDSYGNPTPAALTPDGAVTAALIGSLLYPVLETETGVVAAQYPYYNVLRYGADPTNGQPSNAAFNNCFASAMAATPHGAVYIPAGKYQIENPGLTWTNQNDIRIYGDGPKQSLLVAAGSGSYVILTVSADIGGKTTGLNCNLANFGVQNNSIAGVSGIALYDYLGGSVRDMWLQSSGNTLAFYGMADIDCSNISALTWNTNASGNAALLLGPDSAGQTSGPLRFSCCEFNGQGNVTTGAALTSVSAPEVAGVFLGVYVTTFTNCQFIGIGSGLVSVVELPGADEATFVECYSESSVNTTGNTGSMFRLGNSGGDVLAKVNIIGGHFFNGNGTYSLKYGVDVVNAGQLSIINTNFSNFSTAAVTFPNGLGSLSSISVVNSQQQGGAGTFFDSNTYGGFPTGQFVQQYWAPALASTGWGTPTGATGITNFPCATATLLQTAEVVGELIIQLKKANILGA